MQQRIRCYQFNLRLQWLLRIKRQANAVVAQLLTGQFAVEASHLTAGVLDAGAELFFLNGEHTSSAQCSSHNVTLSLLICTGDLSL
jgi:hypothetical protein